MVIAAMSMKEDSTGKEVECEYTVNICILLQFVTWDNQTTISRTFGIAIFAGRTANISKRPFKPLIVFVW